MSTLYISTTSPYTRILLSIAYLKGIELELRFVVPWENPSELTAANPFSQVPALVWDNGDVVTETPLIIQALAPEIYTHNPAYDLPRISRAFGIYRKVCERILRSVLDWKVKHCTLLLLVPRKP